MHCQPVCEPLGLEDERPQDSFVSSKQGQDQGRRLLPQLEPSSLPFCEASSAQTHFRAALAPGQNPYSGLQPPGIIWPWSYFCLRLGALCRTVCPWVALRAQNRDCHPPTPKPLRPRYPSGPACAGCSRQSVPVRAPSPARGTEIPRPRCCSHHATPSLVQVPAPVTSEFPSFPLQC